MVAGSRRGDDAVDVRSIGWMDGKNQLQLRGWRAKEKMQDDACTRNGWRGTM